ncbi:MAG: hypothetical protein PHP28_02270 [Actinomycetota bacterium]|nr:hypothetical protein [Actinomycetota bacterium]
MRDRPRPGEEKGDLGRDKGTIGVEGDGVEEMEAILAMLGVTT